MSRIRPRSMIFTLYGDYIRHRGGEIWIGSLIKLLSYFGLSEQAVRSALSRMSQQGWLMFRKVGNKSYYALTPAGQELIEEGAKRIFQRRTGSWDGRWLMVVYSIPEAKHGLRERLRRELSWLGFGNLANATWISPHDLRPQLERLVTSLGVKDHVEVFFVTHQGFSDPRAMAARIWELEGINLRYARFIAKYRPLYLEHISRLLDNSPIEASECFVRRFMLIHEYRKFPFIDPELPPELLPAAWLGGEAAKLFQEYHQLLADKAIAFFDSIFQKAPDSNH